MRLRLVFACLMSLTIVCGGFSLLQFRQLRKSLESVSQVEERLVAVRELDNIVLRLINKLYRAADKRQPEVFQTEAHRLIVAFQSETSDIKAILSQKNLADTNRRVLLRDSLTGVIDALPSRVEALVTFAHAGDWLALHARLANHVDHTDDVVSALVREMSMDLSDARRQLLDNVHRAQQRTVQILIATSLFSLAAAGLLGLAIIRSICRPLGDLTVAARAVGRGHFAHQVEIAGNDEFAHLAGVFNRMTKELEDLYARTRQSEAHYRALIEKASDLILVVGRTGEILYASPSSVRVLGHSSGTLIGQLIRDQVHHEEIPLVDGIFSGNNLAPGEMQSFELRVRHYDNSFRVLEGLASNLLEDPAVGGIVVNARDVSERRETEQILRDREDQLRQAQKMEAIGQLAGGIAHDFKNLLTPIVLYSNLLVERLSSGDPCRAHAIEIQNTAEIAADLTRQLLSFSNREVLQPAVINLNDIVSSTERLLRSLIGEDVEVVCNLGASVGAVWADANQIRQVLMNLAVNARDAMPMGGKLTIETANADGDPAPKTGDGQTQSDRYITLTVSDTGHGMDAETRQRAFEPFFTTKAKDKRSGLGLAIVYGIVKRSNGRILVESEVGAGTTFRIYLPRTEPEAVSVELVKPRPTSEGTETVLLVEDQAEVRRSTSISLRRYGYRVIEASSGEEALRLYKSATEPIHVVLTDVVMPGMTGIELSKQLRLLNPTVPMIFVSGYADSVILRHGILDSDIAFLQKPYTTTELTARIREVLERFSQAILV